MKRTIKKKRADKARRMGPKKVPTRAGIISDASACRAAFELAEIPWVLIDGLVLGYVRHNDVVHGDTDVDLAVCKELTDVEWNRLFMALRKHGFNCKNLKQDFVYARRQTKFNMWLYHKKGNFYESFPPTAPGVKFVEKARWYNKIQMVKFLGEIYPMPNHLEDYVAARYGADWEVLRYTHDQWRLAKYGTASSKYEPDVWFKSRCGPNGDLWPRIMPR